MRIWRGRTLFCHHCLLWTLHNVWHCSEGGTEQMDEWALCYGRLAPIQGNKHLYSAGETVNWYCSFRGRLAVPDLRCARSLTIPLYVWKFIAALFVMFKKKPKPYISLFRGLVKLNKIHLSQSALTALTKQTGGLNNKCWCPHSSGGWKSQIRVPSGLSWWGLSLACRHWPSCCVPKAFPPWLLGERSLGSLPLIRTPVLSD